MNRSIRLITFTRQSYELLFNACQNPPHPATAPNYCRIFAANTTLAGVGLSSVRQRTCRLIHFLAIINYMKNYRLSFLVLLFIASAAGQGLRAQGGSVFFSRMLNFGAIDDGKSTMMPLVIINFDSTRFVHGHIGSPSKSVFTLMGSDTFSVAPMTKDTIYIRFSPVDITSIRDSLWITHDGATKYAKNPSKVTLLGQGLTPGDTSARITVLGFGGLRINWSIEVDSSAMRPLVFRNTSDTSIRRLYGNVMGTHAPFTLATGSDKFDLADSAFDTLSFTFAPTDTGTFRDTVLLLSNANVPSDTIRIILTGTSMPHPSDLPHVSLSALYIHFGNVPDGHDSIMSIVLTNTSTTIPLTITMTRIPNPPFSLSMDAGPLDPGKSDTLTVIFNPASAGVYYDTIRFSTNAAAPYAKNNIPLSGTGTEAGVAENVSSGEGMSVTSRNDPASESMKILLTLAKAERINLTLFDAAGTRV
jgi:hypothetical protein